MSVYISLPHLSQYLNNLTYSHMMIFFCAVKEEKIAGDTESLKICRNYHQYKKKMKKEKEEKISHVTAKKKPC